ETADLEDLITSVPAGFSIDPSTLDLSWPDLSDSATKTFSLTLKNVSALPSGSPYYLTNTATVTEDDTGENASDSVEVKILVPSPGLNAIVDAEVSREDKVEYDWTIDKSASPTVVTLGIGKEVPIDYTIKVTREPWETVDSTYTITVSAKVKNDGPGSALGVKIVLKITETGDEVVLAEGLTMAEGEEKTYNKTFTTKTYSPSYTAVLTVTSTNDGSPSDSDTASTPSDPNIVEYVDETADLEDLITSVPAGFSIDPSTLDLSWPLTDSATKTFSLTLKNVSALPSGSPYYLTNTATVTEDDTGEKDTDNETVKINVPEDKDLEIDNEHDMEWDQMKDYSWEIEKSAVPESIELNEGEDGTFAYTLLATRTLHETNIATLTGLATVTNTGNVALTDIDVEIVLKDADGVEIDTFTDTIATLAIGAEKGFPYSFTFDPSSYEAPFKVFAKATDGASDDLETDQPLPLPNVTEYDEDAFVKDTFISFTVPGIEIEGNIYRDWFNIIESADWNSLTNSWSVNYSVTAYQHGSCTDEIPS
ncbi:FxLYD domain-containing protein, partial [Mesotoga sp.]|uniref:FxLYD domain-containing protein n=1 Tax=Mesotoga sp. TaxID=2053577 RepID=UPI00345E5F7E